MTTINKEEIQKFSNLSEEWWDVKGKFKPLHMFNPIRIEYIIENIKRHFNVSYKNNNFLKGLNILDIGCGSCSDLINLVNLGFNQENLFGVDINKSNIN